MPTTVPLKQPIGIALRKLYEQKIHPDIARITMKSLLNLAVGQARFKSNDMWFTFGSLLRKLSELVPSKIT